jgi:hypothetical protein
MKFKKFKKFEKTWQKLRAQKDVKYEHHPVPPIISLYYSIILLLYYSLTRI